MEGEGGAIFFLGSSSSPEIRQCTFAANRSDTCGGAIDFKAVSADCQLHLALCTFIGNEAGGRGGAISFTADAGSDLVVDGCTFSENSAPIGSGVVCGGSAFMVMDNTIIAQGLQGEAIACTGEATATVACSGIWDNEGGDWVGCIEDQFPGNNNFHDDPRFCGVENPQYPYTLDYSSPLVSSSGACGQIGAWWAGCGGVSGVPAPGADRPAWSLAPPQPNPFTCETRLALHVAPGTRVSISVYDPAGRQVRVLPCDVRAGNSCVLVWDGRDDQGELQPAGAYFVGLQAAGVSRGRTVLLLR